MTRPCSSAASLGRHSHQNFCEVCSIEETPAWSRLFFMREMATHVFYWAVIYKGHWALQFNLNYGCKERLCSKICKFLQGFMPNTGGKITTGLSHPATLLPLSHQFNSIYHSDSEKSISSPLESARAAKGALLNWHGRRAQRELWPPQHETASDICCIAELGAPLIILYDSWFVIQEV